MDKLWKRYGLFAVLTALLTAFDQWTKALAYNGLRTGGPIVIWNGVFELLYSENRGAAFGILQGKHGFFFLVAGAVLVVVLLFLARLPWEKRFFPLFACMVLLASGALGNLIDRAMRGFVVDFFYFKLIHFPVFNVADCFVVVSAACLILLVGFFYKEEELSFLSDKKEKTD